MEHSTDLASTGAQLEFVPSHISSSRRTNTSATRHLDLHEKRLNYWKKHDCQPSGESENKTKMLSLTFPVLCVFPDPGGALRAARWSTGTVTPHLSSKSCQNCLTHTLPVCSSCSAASLQSCTCVFLSPSPDHRCWCLSCRRI